MPAGATPSPQTLPDRWIARAEADELDEAARCAHNAGFERRELARLSEFFDRVLPQPLNHEQRAAIVVDEDATLVVASAGSGKTTLLLGKIAYLVVRGLAKPEEIALLAFNNSVRAEIRERLASSHPGVAIHTFHSLGLELVRAASGGACRLSPMATDSAQLQAFLDTELRALALRQPDALAEWLAAYADPLRDAADFASPRAWKAWSRAHPSLTLQGTRVRSQALREVADRLALAGIAYRTGVSLPLLPGVSPYTPDLLLPDARLVIDIGDLAAAFGDGAAPVRGVRDARHGGPDDKGFGVVARRLASTIRACLACRRQRLRRVHLRGAHTWHRDGRLGEHLAALLAPHGLDLAPRALQAVLAGKAGAARLDETVDRLATCLALQRGGQSPEAVPDSGGHSAPGPEDPRDRRRGEAFAALLGWVAARYADHLAARGEIDFGDMIAQAAQALDS
ncbi:MAG: UvrD-helicase domain-containing protein, partial [Burkholderiales bacterium]